MAPDAHEIRFLRRAGRGRPGRPGDRPGLLTRAAHAHKGPSAPPEAERNIAALSQDQNRKKSAEIIDGMQ